MFVLLLCSHGLLMVLRWVRARNVRGSMLHRSASLNDVIGTSQARCEGLLVHVHAVGDGGIPLDVGLRIASIPRLWSERLLRPVKVGAQSGVRVVGQRHRRWAGVRGRAVVLPCP